MNRAQGNKDDQQIDNHGHAQGNERGLRNIRLGLFDFLGNGRDEIVPLKRDERQPHGHQHTAQPLWEKWGEITCRLFGGRIDKHEPVPDKNQKHENLGDGDHVLRLARHLRAAYVQPDKDAADDQRHQRNRRLDTDRRLNRMADVRQVLVEKLPEISRKPQRVETAGHRVGEPEHPSGQKPHGTGKRLLNERIAPACLGNRR